MDMEMKTLLAGAALAAGLALAGAAQAGIVLDGDFSTPSGGGSFTTYSGGSSIGPWLVTGGGVDLIGGYWQAPTAGGGSVCGPGQRHRGLHRRQRGTGVALAGRHHGVDGVVLGVGPFEIQTAADQRAQVVRRQGVQPPQ